MVKICMKSDEKICTTTGKKLLRDVQLYTCCLSILNFSPSFLFSFFFFHSFILFFTLTFQFDPSLPTSLTSLGGKMCLLLFCLLPTSSLVNSLCWHVCTREINSRVGSPGHVTGSEVGATFQWDFPVYGLDSGSDPVTSKSVSGQWWTKENVFAELLFLHSFTLLLWVTEGRLMGKFLLK